MIKSKITLESLLSEELRLKIIKLLYLYWYLDEDFLNNLFYTDLIIYKINFKSETKLYSVKSQKCYFSIYKWWMWKLINKEIKNSIYKSMLTINEFLFSWNVRVVFISKKVNDSSDNKLWLVFNYHCVYKTLSETYIKLTEWVHNYLIDSWYNIYYTADLKHVYFLISLYKLYRFYYVFTISELKQLQLIKMFQDSVSSVFIMRELINVILKLISLFNSSEFLLYEEDELKLSKIIVYINDLYKELKISENLYQFLQDKLFSRIEWVKLKLFFKKLKLFISQIRVLRIIH